MHFLVHSRLLVPLVTALVSLTLGFALIGCTEQPVEKEELVRPVKMLPISTGRFEGAREYPGKVEAIQDAEMSFEVEGKVTRFNFKEGDMVKKGAVLARLDPRDYQSSLDAEIARRNAARAEYERIRSLYEVEAVSRKDLDVARKDLEVTVANVERAQKALQDTYLRAPFSGRFAKRLVERFENVVAKQPVLLLQDNSVLKMILHVPERDVSASRRGKTVEEINKSVKVDVTITTIPGRRFPAKIREFATAADPTTRTFQVTLEFANPPDASIFPGMTAKAVVEGQEAGESRAKVPANAVLADEGGTSYVWRVDPSSMTVQKRGVTLGELSGSEVVILAGLANGDLVAVSGVRNLREGMKVRRLEEHRR